MAPRTLAAALLAGAGLVGVGALAKLPETVLPIGTDTGMYATYARLILHGGRPYVDFYDVHPPLTYYYWAVVEALAGTDWSRTCVGSWGGLLAPQPCISLLAHGLDLGLTCLAALLAYAIARRSGERPLVGLLASLFVVWFADVSMISMEGSNPTKLTLVPATLAVYAFMRARGGHAVSWGWAILSGGAGVLAGLAKQPGLLTLIALVAYVSPGLFRGGPVAARARQLCLGLAIGAAGMLAVTGLGLWWIGALQGFLDEAWVYNAERFLIGYWQTPAGLASPQTRLDRVATGAAGLLFLGALIGGLALAFGPPRPRQRLLLVWAGFSLVAVGGFREFAQVIPSLALLAALGIGRVWTAAGRDGLGLGRPIAGRLALVALLGSVFVLSTGFQVIEMRRAIFERGPGARPADPELIATYLRQVAPPGPLFVWGNAGQVYALSGRQPATRFIIAEFTNTSSPRPDRSRDEAMRDMQANPPAVVVVDPHTDESGLQLSGFPRLAQLLAACYQKVAPGADVPNWGVFVQVRPCPVL
ncbi:MAG TPA: hypothetical protein VKV73_22860 [Chloroflexota bacterium]|nr:hypothetical protein [Chloroflexota bacterium]